MEWIVHHPDIEAWLASRPEMQRLNRLEEKAADAWWNSLTLEQQKVYAELTDAFAGLNCLRGRILRARVATEEESESN
jgi:hypothetical protein